MRDMHGILFAYASHPHLRELTERRTASSVPFGGRYRVIDFMLNNMCNAGITDVGVIMRENYQSLLDHLGSGKDWDLARKLGGLRLLPPFGYAGAHRDGVFQGNMEALIGVSAHLQHIRQEYVVLAGSDMVVSLPLEEVFDCHRESGADITCVCTPHCVGQPDSDVFFHLSKKNSILDVSRGRAETAAYQGLSIYVLSTALLLNLVSLCAAHNLYDFERDVLQRMGNRLNLSAYVFSGYCAQIRSVSSYFSHSMDLLRAEVRTELFPPSRPVKTKVRDEASAYYGPDSRVSNCLVADGCYIEGAVKNCILFRGVTVEAGAQLENCILMQNTRIQAGANLNNVITDKDVLINRGRMLMGHENYPLAISKGSSV